MALPSKLVDELMKRDQSDIVGWSWRIFMFGLTALITSLGFYFGLAYGFKYYLNLKNNDLAKEEMELNKAISGVDENNIILFYSRFYNIKQILNNRKNLSELLMWLSKNIHPDVILNNFTFNQINNQLNLKAISKSKNSALEQFLLLERSPDVESVALNNLSYKNNDQWEFDLTVILKKSEASSSTNEAIN